VHSKLLAACQAAHELQAEVARISSIEVRSRRYADDVVTLSFWLVVLKKDYSLDNPDVVILRHALLTIHSHVLRKNRKEPCGP
jgi:hypothetical protein